MGFLPERILPRQLYNGLMFLCVLPSTVQSSIAFTSIARGNVAAALCSASASNLIGIVLTPLLVGLLLGPSISAAAMAAYLLEGAAGLPVLVPGFGGLLPLGASAGYLLSYPLAAALAGLLFTRPKRGFAGALFAASAADLLILASGAAWLGLLTHGSVSGTLRLAVLPFLAGDAIKVVLAAGLAQRFSAGSSPAPRVSPRR